MQTETLQMIFALLDRTKASKIIFMISTETQYKAKPMKTQKNPIDGK